MGNATPARQVAAYIRESIAGLTEVSLPDIAADTVAHFGGDQEFVMSAYLELFPSMAHRIAMQVVSELRGVRVSYEAHTEDASGEAAKDAASKKPRRKWFDCLEYTGEKHIRVVSMTKVDLIAAAEIREQRGTTDIQIGGLWRKLARGMKDGETVGDRYKEEEIARWQQLLKVRFTVSVPLPKALATPPTPTQEAAD